MVREIETCTSEALQVRSRVLVRTLGYRCLMVVITVLVAWMVVGDVSAALNIGFATNVVKTGTYFAYERLWDHVSWGVTVAR